MKIYRINNFLDKKKQLENLKVTTAGINIILDKMELILFKINNLRTPAVNIRSYFMQKRILRLYFNWNKKTY